MAYMANAIKGNRTSARVQVIEEVTHDEKKSLCFQWCRYVYGNGEIQEGYRFIWRREDGSLQAARGQARIPSIAVARELLKKAEDAGWGKSEAD